jgi:hypothetical protein
MRGDAGYAYLPAGQAETEFAKYETRIKALERQCATLATQVDRQAKVVDAAHAWRISRSASARTVTAVILSEKVDEYQRQMAQLAKDDA